MEVTSYQEATPVIAIDFVNETLTGFVGGEEYLINNDLVDQITIEEVKSFGDEDTKVLKAEAEEKARIAALNVQKPRRGRPPKKDKPKRGRPPKKVTEKAKRGRPSKKK